MALQELAIAAHQKHNQQQSSGHFKSASSLNETQLKSLNESFFGPDGYAKKTRSFAKSLRHNPINGHPDVDRIQRYLQHLEYCCKIYSGFDIYQILAFRRLHGPSRIATRTKPFKLLGWKWEIRIHSQYSDSVVTAIVIGALQLVGISVILGETVWSYFQTADEDELTTVSCEYQLEHWTGDGGIFKVLALLFAAMISIQLNKTIQAQRHSGFTELLSSIDEEDFPKMHFIDITLLQCGLIVNVYTLFCAVIGSFFLIYASEGGEQALDMVLNSITLFFMVGLDDLLVSTNDYEDVEEYVSMLYKDYMSDKQLMFQDDIDVQCCGVRGLTYCDRFIDFFQFILVSLTYICGTIGPFVIALCW